MGNVACEWDGAGKEPGCSGCEVDSSMCAYFQQAEVWEGSQGAERMKG
jgi:hypothetical protein